MRMTAFSRRAIVACATAVLLAGCGGSNGLSLTSPVPLAPQIAGLTQQRPAPGTERVIYSFKGGYDATYPYAGLIAVKGALYGTTLEGGAYTAGTVFAMSTSGKERIVYSFKGGTDGSGPVGGLIAVGGELYGTTSGGGAYGGVGTVFAVSTSGKERVLHSFGSGNDGKSPFAEDLVAVGSELYGTTQLGGASRYGTVFEVSTSGKERVVYSFRSGNDGAYPFAGLIAVGKELYGTTYNGGASNFGTVFEVSTPGKERVLHSFGGSDGSDPEAPLIAVADELYGTTSYGGAYAYASYPGGTVFEVSTSGKERVLHSFGKSSSADGIWPYAGLVAVGGLFYGTTLQGGAKGAGTVFSISTSGSEHVLHSFYGKGSDGISPYAGLVALGSELYGTTALGPGQSGGSGYGTVFKITP